MNLVDLKNTEPIIAYSSTHIFLETQGVVSVGSFLNAIKVSMGNSNVMNFVSTQKSNIFRVHNIEFLLMTGRQVIKPHFSSVVNSRSLNVF